MKLADMKQLSWISRRRLDAAAQELALADARHEAARQALARHRKTMMSELALGCQPDMWAGIASWYRAAEHQLDDLQAMAGRLAGEADVAREALRTAMKEAEGFKAVTAALRTECKAEASKRMQDELDDATLRRRHDGHAKRS
jgi:hypothetical protein